MIAVPAGRFAMGSSDQDTARDLEMVTGTYLTFARARAQEFFAYEHPQHQVDLGHAFALGRYLVTRGEFAIFVRESGYSVNRGCVIHNGNKLTVSSDATWENPGFSQTDRDPVVCVSWFDAQAYISWLNQKFGHFRPSGAEAIDDYRLPTEAEWEYAARARTQTARWWGDAIGVGNANCHGCGSKWDYLQAAPVGSFAANPYGLFDMIGNAFQWVSDCWNDSYVGAPVDGSSWTAGDCTRAVARGGGWFSDTFALRSAARTFFLKNEHLSSMGFRIAQSIR